MVCPGTSACYRCGCAGALRVFVSLCGVVWNRMSVYAPCTIHINVTMNKIIYNTEYILDIIPKADITIDTYINELNAKSPVVSVNLSIFADLHAAIGEYA